MIDTKIRIKEKTNSYMCKVKITKESLEDYKTPEGMGEFKKDLLEAFSAELDSYITDMIEIEDGIEMMSQVREILKTVNIVQDEKTEEVVETEDEEK